MKRKRLSPRQWTQARGKLPTLISKPFARLERKARPRPDLERSLLGYGRSEDEGEPAVDVPLIYWPFCWSK